MTSEKSSPLSRVVEPQKFDEHALRVSMAPNALLWLFKIFLFYFYAKERRLQNQEKKFGVVIELLLF